MIGLVDEAIWLKFGGGLLSSKATKKQRVPKPDIAQHMIDGDDHIYLSEIYSSSPAPVKIEIYKEQTRNGATGVKSLKNALYKCELERTNKTFNRATGDPYIEAHHLIPLSETKPEFNLGFVENIVPLCPNCHRAVHYAKKITRPNLVEKLLNLREKKINRVRIPISLSNLLRMYNCI